MGILDTLFGGGDQSQGGAPHPLGILGGLAAHLSPHAYEAAMQRRSQMADYGAMQGMKDLPPGMASAFAQDPGFRQQLGGAYFPAAPQTVMQTGASGETFPLSIANPGGAGGHGGNVMDMPILPPGTTSSPTAAVSPPPNAGPQQSQPGGMPQQQTETSPGKTVMTGGLPGSQIGELAAIEKAKAEGRDPMQAVSPYTRGVAQQVLDNKLTIKDLESTRFRGVKTAVERVLAVAHPELDYNVNAMQNEYRTQYASEKGNTVGGRVVSIGKLAHHGSGLGDALLNSPNIGLGGSNLAEYYNKPRNYLGSTSQAEVDKKDDAYTQEYSTYVSNGGNPGTGQEREERRKFYGAGTPPQARGAALLSDAEYIEGQADGMQKHQAELFKTNPKIAETMPIVPAQARYDLNQMKIKGHMLKGDLDTWAQTPEGANIIRVDPQGKRWTRDASGKVIPFGNK